MSGIFGNKLKISIFGESHGPAIGVVADGFPAGESVDIDELMQFMARRSAQGKSYATARKEPDIPVFLSGFKDGRILSSPLAAIIENKSQHSADYSSIADVPRPGHADFTAIARHGENVDLRGGGHYSGRLTAPLCIAGGIAIQILRRRGIEVFAHTAQIKDIYDRRFDPVKVGRSEREILASSELCVLDSEAEKKMLAAILQGQSCGDSVGGVIECAVTGLKAGSCGEHIFDGLEGRIAHAIFSIPAVKGVEFGEGFACAAMTGSENNDEYAIDENHMVSTVTNHAGGILGGTANGMPIIVRAAIKPTPSIYKPQQSVSLSGGAETRLEIKGRHDPCIVVRAVPCIESAAAIAVLDALLESHNNF